jgi:hypothetical protein
LAGPVVGLEAVSERANVALWNLESAMADFFGKNAALRAEKPQQFLRRALSLPIFT